MQPFCRLDPAVGEIAKRIPEALERLGVSRVYARYTAIDWLKHRCNCPLLIAACMYECITADKFTGCSHGNKICDLGGAGDCDKFRHYGPR